MPNRRYNDQESDTVSKEKGKGGMLNDDGRLMGKSWDKQSAVPGDPLGGKLVVDPNEGGPRLNKGKNRPGMDEAAY